MWCMATAWSADEFPVRDSTQPWHPQLQVRTHARTRTHKHGHGRGNGCTALCKIITAHLHSLWCGFVAIIRREKSWIFTHTLSNYDNRHYSQPHLYLSGKAAAAEAGKVGWDSLLFLFLFLHTLEIVLNTTFFFISFPLSASHHFSPSLLFRPPCSPLYLCVSLHRPSVRVVVVSRSLSCFTTFFQAYSLLKSIVAREEEG